MKIAVLFILIAFMAGLAVLLLMRRPATTEEQGSQKYCWCIGIYTGSSPFQLSQPLSVVNPLIKPSFVADFKASDAADPFMLQEGSNWYLFFEAVNATGYVGKIALARSGDGFNWTYCGIVLNEPFHISYPYVFKWQTDFYMIPESKQADAIRLYKAEPFPATWVYLATLVKGEYKDTSIFRYGNKWWLFAGGPRSRLHLFFADSLTGPWKEHPQSPIIKGDRRLYRPGGRIILYKDRIYRFAQDGIPKYGSRVWAREITTLTTTDYAEQPVAEVPVIAASGTGWNSIGMHTVDPHPMPDGSWIACVDGYGPKEEK